MGLHSIYSLIFLLSFQYPPTTQDPRNPFPFFMQTANLFSLSPPCKWNTLIASRDRYGSSFTSPAACSARCCAHRMSWQPREADTDYGHGAASQGVVSIIRFITHRLIGECGREGKGGKGYRRVAWKMVSVSLSKAVILTLVSAHCIGGRLLLLFLGGIGINVVGSVFLFFSRLFNCVFQLTSSARFLGGCWRIRL